MGGRTSQDPTQHDARAEEAAAASDALPGPEAVPLVDANVGVRADAAVAAHVPSDEAPATADATHDDPIDGTITD